MFNSFKRTLQTTPLFIGVIVLAACAGSSRPSAAPPTQAPQVTRVAPTATQLPATAVPSATKLPTAKATATPVATVAATQVMTAAPATTESAKVTATMEVKLATVDYDSNKILVGDGSRTLYIFLKDQKETSTCNDACAKKWPPVLTEGKPEIGQGLDSKLVGTAKRKDGMMQLTYKGMPLYYFEGDKAKGDTKGQDLGNVWFVIASNGEIIKK